MKAQAPASDLIIRDIAETDRALWDPLWKGYLEFYEKSVPDEATEFTWKRLQNS
jgi:hypothetical protein